MDVLQPARRRRRRRRPRFLAALLVVAGLAVAAVILVGHRADHARPADTAAAPAPPRRDLLRSPRSRHRSRLHPLLHVRGGPRIRLAGTLAARGAILVDAGDGAVLYARYPHRRLPVASTTKIMTALLVLRHDRLDRVVRVARSVPRVPLVKEGLRAGERVPIWKLLYGLLLYSGNDDAAELGLATSGTRTGFLRLMNDEAHSLGLRDTHFNSPSGVLDERNYSSAWDLAALTRVALWNAIFRRIVRTRVERVRWAPPTYAKVYVNRNLLLWQYRGAIGVKTGFTTAAGDCLVAAARRHGRTLIAVLLHDPRSYADAIELLDRGWRTPP